MGRGDGDGDGDCDCDGEDEVWAAPQPSSTPTVKSAPTTMVGQAAAKLPKATMDAASMGPFRDNVYAPGVDTSTREVERGGRSHAEMLGRVPLEFAAIPLAQEYRALG